MPVARAASVDGEGSATPTAVEAICTAIAAPIDAKNQDGILVLCARVARASSASFSAAEASAALGM